MVSAIKVQITAEKKWINLIFVYGLSEKPMMVASNMPIKEKEDVIKIVRCYIDRWRIEEYFKFKKQEYKFENTTFSALTDTLYIMHKPILNRFIKRCQKKMELIKLVNKYTYFTNSV